MPLCRCAAAPMRQALHHAPHDARLPSSPLTELYSAGCSPGGLPLHRAGLVSPTRAAPLCGVAADAIPMPWTGAISVQVHGARRRAPRSDCTVQYHFENTCRRSLGVRGKSDLASVVASDVASVDGALWTNRMGKARFCRPSRAKAASRHKRFPGTESSSCSVFYCI